MTPDNTPWERLHTLYTEVVSERDALVDIAPLPPLPLGPSPPPDALVDIAAKYYTTPALSVRRAYDPARLPDSTRETDRRGLGERVAR
jgi:hypothetical protein